METIELNINVTSGRKKVFLLLVLFFLCWRPGFLGSESLTLTTYYPAPYGGYVGLLTTGKTLLARDSDSVGIGTPGPVPTNVALAVHSKTTQGAIAISGLSDAGNTYSGLYLNDVNLQPSVNSWYMVHKKMLGTIESNDFQIGRRVLTTSRTDFVIDWEIGNVGINTINPTERLHVNSGNLKVSNGNINISGNGSTTGFITGLCTWRGMVGTGWSYCAAGENLVNTNFSSWVSEWACIGSYNNTCVAGTKTTGLSGNMLCCRIQ